MTNPFLLEDQIHDADDLECSVCAAGYPTRCVCGGLMHAAAEVDEESETVMSTQCGKCGRSEDNLEEDVA
jgi:hypothetical protein